MDLKTGMQIRYSVSAGGASGCSSNQRSDEVHELDGIPEPVERVEGSYLFRFRKGEHGGEKQGRYSLGA